MDLWQRLTPRARVLIWYSTEEAKRFRRYKVEPEHLLLGLLDSPSTATQIIESMGTTADEIREKLEPRMTAASKLRPREPLLTRRGKRVIDLAIDESYMLHHAHVGTEHILLALLRAKNRTVTPVWVAAGITLEAVREAVKALPPRADEEPAPSEDIDEQAAE